MNKRKEKTLKEKTKEKEKGDTVPETKKSG